MQTGSSSQLTNSFFIATPFRGDPGLTTSATPVEMEYITTVTRNPVSGEVGLQNREKKGDIPNHHFTCEVVFPNPPTMQTAIVTAILDRGTCPHTRCHINRKIARAVQDHLHNAKVDLETRIFNLFQTLSTYLKNLQSNRNSLREHHLKHNRRETAHWNQYQCGNRSRPISVSYYDIPPQFYACVSLRINNILYMMQIPNSTFNTFIYKEDSAADPIRSRYRCLTKDEFDRREQGFIVMIENTKPITRASIRALVQQNSTQSATHIAQKICENVPLGKNNPNQISVLVHKFSPLSE